VREVLGKVLGPLYALEGLKSDVTARQLVRSRYVNWYVRLGLTRPAMSSV
jgi:hypothetical protein